MIWWTERIEFHEQGISDIYVSDIIPNGSVVHCVKIQCRTASDKWDIACAVLLRVTNSQNPTIAEMLLNEQIIRWDFEGVRSAWFAVLNPSDDEWNMRHVLTGSHLRFAVAVNTAEQDGVDVRVGVLYSPK